MNWKPLFFHPLGKIGVLAQKTISRMNGLGIRHLGGQR